MVYEDIKDARPDRETYPGPFILEASMLTTIPIVLPIKVTIIKKNFVAFSVQL